MGKYDSKSKASEEPITGVCNLAVQCSHRK